MLNRLANVVLAAKNIRFKMPLTMSTRKKKFNKMYRLMFRNVRKVCSRSRRAERSANLVFTCTVLSFLMRF